MTQSRRRFLQTSGILLASSIAGNAFGKTRKLPLSFSTLGCPDWSFSQIVSFAVQHGYKGLEIRGIMRQMDLPLVPEFSQENLNATLALMKNNGLHFVNLGSSCNLHIVDKILRNKNLDEAKRFIDLAEKLDCPYIRVFPNNFPKEQDKQKTIGLITEGLVSLGDYAKGSKVAVLMETHGEVVFIEDLASIMNAANHPKTGLIWDVSNMWTVTKETPANVYAQLHKYIRHVHVKDALISGDKLQYTFLGKGDVPILDAINLLKQNNYKGYYSFEWEKLWHPELAEPGEAFADYAKWMREKF